MSVQTSGRPPPMLGPSQILTRCRDLVQPALESAVGRLHPLLRRMAAFSFGWCDVDGTPVADGGGKGVRQALAVLSAEAAGTSVEDAISGAVAVELVHAFSLVHDDIMDGDDQRRHRATVWKAYGIGPGVLAGDALFALAVEAVANAPNQHACAAMSRIGAVLVQLVNGQAEDLDFETRPWVGPEAVSVEEYRAMAERKTGALLGCASAIGAVLAGAPPPLVDALSAAGRHLGLVFQAVDDLLGIWGDPEVTGKPVFSDLRRGKKTLPVLAAIRSGTCAGHRLAEVLGSRDRLDERALLHAAELVEQAGGRSFTRRESQQHLDRALRILENAPLQRPAAAELAVLAGFLNGRTT